MRTRFYIPSPVLLICLVLFLAGCSDDKSSNSDSNKITQTDASGTVISVDPNDWCGNDTTWISLVHPAPEGILLPCSTFFDSISKTFNIDNVFTRDLEMNLTWSDTCIFINPDTATVPVGGSRTFDIKFKLLADSSHEDVVSINLDDFSMTQYLFYKAGFIADTTFSIAFSLPAAYSSNPACPNPTEDYVSIPFAMPASGRVLIRIYNSNDALVATVKDSTYSAGYHTVIWNAGAQPEGYYNCKINLGNNYSCQGDILISR